MTTKTMRYSAKTGGFYSTEIHKKIPDDAVAITDDQYNDLLAGQSLGKIIGSNDKGYPILIESVIEQQTIEQLRESMSLSAADARIRLAKAGLLLRVIETINTMPDDSILKIKWEYETIFKRLDTTLVDFCNETLGMDDEQIDALFM